MSTSTSSRRPAKAGKRAYHHGDLRKALIQTTLGLIPATGVRELSLREVARTAGVSHAASYRHFPNKESLLAAIAEEGFSMLADALREAAASSGSSAIAKLEAAGVAYVDFGTRHPHHLQVMFSGAIARFDDHPGLQTAARVAHEALQGIVAETVRTGAIHADEQVLEAAAWSIVH